MITKSTIIGGALALCAWLGISLITMAQSSVAPAALVLFPSQEFVKTLPDDIRILSHDRHSITLSVPDKHYGDLYAHGARFVFPAGLSGCVPIPATGGLTT